MMDINNHAQHAADYSECPIPATHRRLADAHLLWHQALLSYQEPDAFRANLNATIQALRNITFALQSEKHSIANFDRWYGGWQARLAGDRDAKWLIDARNIVVKQGDLELTSIALVRVLTWKDNVLLETQIPPGAPTSLILNNLPLLDLLKGSQVANSDLGDAALEIERRWSVAALQGREILETLAQIYGLLGDVVLDAHAQVNRLQCIPMELTHPDFRSAYHRTGFLECMAVGREQRTQRSKLSSGESYEVVSGSAPVSAEDLKKAPKRYELGKEHYTEAWQSSDPIAVAEKILARAKQILKKDKSHARMMFIRDGHGTWHQILLHASDRTEKHILMRVAASFIERVGADALIEISEAWILPASAFFELDQHDMEDAPSKREVLQLVVATREGIRRAYVTPFSRGMFGRIKLEETDQSDDARGFHYLIPIFEVWRRQRTKMSDTGEVRYQVWEPDPLDICFCGGPKRFIECCRPMMDDIRASDSIQQDIETALKNGDAALAEHLARASLAQYVIWIKQHTAPTRHVAEELHRDFIHMDVLALQTHVHQLNEILTANEHADALVPAVEHLSEIIGVPEIAVRLIALAGQSLWQSGDVAGAIAQLEALGKLDQVNDTLALVLASKLMALPSGKILELLKKAVDAACDDSERLFAKLELAKYSIGSGDGTSALCELDSAIAEASPNTNNRSMVADALALRWQVTQNDDDFHNARTALEALDPEQHWQTLASLLIDHGDYDDANAVLAKPLESGDVVARLLTVDTRLRTGETDLARELLLALPIDSVDRRLLYSYWHTTGLVALMCDDPELKPVAASNLRKLVALDRSLLKTAETLLAALES
jgi:hypothetical protein